MDMSEEATELLDKWEHVPVARPNWDHFYMTLAYVAAERSEDAQTHVGCFIVDREHRPLGFGYNGFIRGVDTSHLPNTRPDKYPFFIHAEINAILNCGERPVGSTAYVTGIPCNHCLQVLWQAGVSEIVYNKNSRIVSIQNEDPIREILLSLMRENGFIYRGIDYVRD
jgi:dCMP deaminase